MKYFNILLVLFVSSCTINPYLDEEKKDFDGSFYRCSVENKVGVETLSLNLKKFEDTIFNLNNLSSLLGNPIDKKNIDNIEYYYFGSPGESGGCSVTVPVKNKQINGISVYGTTESCSSFTESSVKQNGKFYYLYVGWQFMLGEGNCGEWAIFERL